MDQETKSRDITTGAVVTPPPAWVEVLPYTIPETPNPHFIANGVCVLLDDAQIDLCGADRAWYYRRADMVTAAGGAERAAQFSVSFDPSFERVEVHSIAVIRAGHRIEHAHTAFFEVLRRERNLERLHFDGRLTLHVTLPDVRAGDVVETAHTLYGMRKSLNGRHSTFIPMEWSVGIVEVRIRQRTPAGRSVHERRFNDPPEARQSEADGVVERRWHTLERAGIKYEALAPPWIIQGAMIQFSEWRDWADVAQAFTPLYEDVGELSPDVEAEIARIAASEQTPEARAAAVLRFTQNEVRYLAISMGEGGYTPRTLAQICETRYGDCKDKTKLYVAMARRLGLDACPTLVNTRDGPALDGWLPAQVFDHCVVRLRIGGVSYWLDPTQQMQLSPLSALAQARFGWALPLTPETRALEHMGEEPHDHTLECVESIALGATPQAPVKYEWKLTTRGWRAEGTRLRFAREGEVGLFKLYADDIMRSFHGAKPVAQQIVGDDVAANAITTIERYEITDAWTRHGENQLAFATLDLFLRPTLAKLDPGPRKLPIDLGHRGRLTRRVEIQTETPWKVTPWSKRIEGTALSFSSGLLAHSQHRFELIQSVDIRSWTLPADEAQIYRDVVAELDKSDLELATEVRNGKFVIEKRNRAGEIWDVVRWVLLAALAGYWVWRATTAA